jgi:hypothetical protein
MLPQDQVNARASLVVSKCERKYHEYVQNDSNVRACVIVVSTLTMESNNLQYRESDNIAGWGYSIYAAYHGGWIKNNGNRGFENWCAVGNQHQQDNIIYID